MSYKKRSCKLRFTSLKVIIDNLRGGNVEWKYKIKVQLLFYRIMEFFEYKNEKICTYGRHDDL